MLIRPVMPLGNYILGSSAFWLSPKSLVLFWVTDHLLFQKMGVNRVNWVLAAWFIQFWPRNSLWMGFFVDTVIALVFYLVGGFLMGLLIAAEGVVNT